MHEHPIYLDHNATAPLLPEVVDAMVPYLREHFGNPSSAHVYGRRAKAAVDQARAQVAALLGAAAEEIFFVAHGTEANNLAIRGVLAALPEKRHVVTCVTEHPATVEPCRQWEKQGGQVTWLPVDGEGRIHVSEAVAALRSDTALVTLMHANNETGVLQPIAEVAREARARGVLMHTDAAQSVGKLPVSVEGLGVDLLTVVGHKFGAPKGVGALYVRKGTPVRPVLLGAGHERGLRPGTENVASIVGLGVACEVALRTVETESARVRGLRDELWERLRARVPGLALNGHPVERLPNTLNVRFPGVSGTALLAAAPEVAASTGSACHAGEESASSIITAMGVEPSAALGSVRLTLGRTTTREDVVAAAEALATAWKRWVERARAGGP
ncbi:MAG TPA: cysteine desulfurase family protein [Archangium sp.]|uniref:cysteine desulfurase family protein n=1 Tax=Archangium sp. TaxID=1872627 RepID=UPI002E308969|nr:cysteine desulfurase family protein [Archangium sp.]HEX5744896.1 cysteine desulfurase family protein [Archangium sp.]